MTSPGSSCLNGYTCTECGRCTSACPANTTGKLLNPRKIIVDVRARTMEKAPAACCRADVGRTDVQARRLLGHQLLDNFITEQELWACTTCMACVQECPVMIEHVDAIVDMRRGLVLNESRFPEELKTTFSNLERNYTPWGFGHATRADWAEGLDIPLMADERSAECCSGWDVPGPMTPATRRCRRAFAQLMKMAGVDFAILGTEEKCNGDPARRMGNEYLAQTLMTENIATLNGYGVKKIVVTCPHCLQSLGKEYKQFGGDYEVMHHTTFLQELDPRGEADALRRTEGDDHIPRSLLSRPVQRRVRCAAGCLEQLGGVRQVEMQRSHDGVSVAVPAGAGCGWRSGKGNA